jgi:hypothetical protein
MRIIILEQWSIIDRWWRPKDEQIRHEYVHVDWNGRKIVFVKKNAGEDVENLSSSE